MSGADYIYFLGCFANLVIWIHYLILVIQKRKRREHYEKYGSDNVDNALQRFDA